MAPRIPASERTSQQLRDLLTQGVGDGDARAELLKLAVKKIVEEALRGQGGPTVALLPKSSSATWVDQVPKRASLSSLRRRVRLDQGKVSSDLRELLKVPLLRIRVRGFA